MIDHDALADLSVELALHATRAGREMKETTTWFVGYAAAIEHIGLCACQIIATSGDTQQIAMLREAFAEVYRQCAAETNMNATGAAVVRHLGLRLADIHAAPQLVPPTFIEP